VHAHLARDMGQNLMTILELDLEHSIGKRLDYRALKLNRIFFAQLSTALSQKLVHMQSYMLLQYDKNFQEPICVIPL
jgi:hypothetical protein